MKKAHVALIVSAVLLVTGLVAMSQAQSPWEKIKKQAKEKIKEKVDEQLDETLGKDAPDQQPQQENQPKLPPKPGQIIVKAPAAPANAAELKQLRMEIKDYPRVDGSTSAHPLGMVIATTQTRKSWLWAVDGSGTRRLVPVAYTIGAGRSVRWRGQNSARKVLPVATAPPIDVLKDSYVLKDLKDRTWHNGTNQGYVSLIEGKCELILECRLPSEDERKLMAAGKVDLVATPIALDAFVFLLNARNPTKGLTADQIRDAYTGKITNWKTVGGPDIQLRAYIRNRNSGSQETMQTLVMKDRKITAGRSMIAHTMAGPYNQLPRDTGGIGFTFYYYHEYMSPMPGMKLAAVDGVEPSAETIASKKYRFVTEVYVVHRKDLKADSPAAKLVGWMLTDEGQKAIGLSGYTPIRPAKSGNQ